MRVVPGGGFRPEVDRSPGSHPGPSVLISQGSTGSPVGSLPRGYRWPLRLTALFRCESDRSTTRAHVRASVRCGPRCVDVGLMLRRCHLQLVEHDIQGGEDLAHVSRKVRSADLVETRRESSQVAGFVTCATEHEPAHLNVHLQDVHTPTTRRPGCVDRERICRR